MASTAAITIGIDLQSTTSPCPTTSAPSENFNIPPFPKLARSSKSQPSCLDRENDDRCTSTNTPLKHCGSRGRGERRNVLSLCRTLQGPGLVRHTHSTYETPESAVSGNSSPVSLCQSSGSSIGREETYRTPETSPEGSPVLQRPTLCHFPPLLRAQIDGPSDSGDGSDEDHDDVARVPNHTATEGRCEATYPSSKDEDIRNTSPTQPDVTDLTACPPSEDETPLVPASPAKGAFIFSESDAPGVESRRSRRPSELLRHCERNATPRQRRLMATGLRSPDRFIPSRASTPNKDTLNMLRPKDLPGRSLPSPDSDPFAPAPRRTFRMAEQYATLSGPPPILRSAGRTATMVNDTRRADQRALSESSIWTVGGHLVTEGVASTSNGRGGRVTSGTSAPHYTADFLRNASAGAESWRHGRRLALAMGLAENANILDTVSPVSSAAIDSGESSSNTRVWRDGIWERDIPGTPTKTKAKKPKDIPIIPFRVLDAPALRDDYYCSLLAYSPTVQCLAVGLGPHVYLWSETRGNANANIPDSLTAPFATHVTSISFSSAQGGSAASRYGVRLIKTRALTASSLLQCPAFASAQIPRGDCLSESRALPWLRKSFWSGTKQAMCTSTLLSGRTKTSGTSSTGMEA
jgi:hypothetical protein